MYWLKKTKKQLYPFNLEKEYRQVLLYDISLWESDIKRLIIPRIGLWKTEFEEQKGRKDAWAEDINSIMSELHLTIGRRSEAFLKGKLPLISGKTNSFNKKEFGRVINAALGVDLIRHEPWLKDQLDKWISDNTNLIRQLRTETTNKVHNIVSEGLTQGQRVETIAENIISKGKIKALGASPFDSTKSALQKARNRAKLIADDQIGKLNSQLTERRQNDLGVKRYRWRNVGDRRVRGNPAGLYPDATYDHWAREGKIYSWDKPPQDGHPGYPVRCRCWAEAVLEDIVDFEESSPSNVLLKTKEQVEHSLKSPVEYDNIANVFSGAVNPNEVIAIMKKHPAIGFINKDSFMKTVSQKNTLQFGLFRMRMGNLLRGAIKRGNIPVKPVAAVKKVILEPKPVTTMKLKPAAKTLTKTEYSAEVRKMNSEWVKPRFNKLTVEDLGIKEGSETKQFTKRLSDPNLKHEILGVFDSKTGKQLAEVKGEANTVSYGKNIEKLTTGNITVHNHIWDDFWEMEPSFSYADIKYSLVNNEKISKAVTKTKDFYMYDNKGFSGDEKKFDKLYKDKYKKILQKNEKIFVGMERNDKITAKEKDFLVYDNTAREFINEIGLSKYAWVLRKK